MRAGMVVLGILGVLCLWAMPATAAEEEAGLFSAGGWEAWGLTDLATSMAEFRVGHRIGEFWTAGLLGTWFAEDAEEPSSDWGLGAYATLAVDPNASFPLAGWLPRLGDWLKLPESIKAQTYLIGKVQALPYEDQVDLAASIGGGARSGPLCIEVVYDVIEGGDADNPVATSGLTVWAGLRIEF